MNERGLDLMDTVGHAASLGAIVLSFAGIIPAVVSLIAAVYYTIQIYQTETVQLWMRHRRLRKIEKYQALIRYLENNELERIAHQLRKPATPEDERHKKGEE